VRLAVSDPGKRRETWHAVQRALGRYLAQHCLDNVQLHLAAQPPTPDPLSGKAREVIVRASGTVER
jgi:hypothetical protein